MPTVNNPYALTVQPPARRLKLNMPSPDRQQSAAHALDAPRATPREPGSSTPPRPSYSPVTPTLSQANLSIAEHPTRPPPEWIEEPEALPVSSEDNSDAIALRAAISILQLQRERSLRDIRTLDKMKVEALRQPESFAEHLKAGKLSQAPPVGINNLDDSEDEDVDVEHPDDNGEVPKKEEIGKFGKFPTPQNVVRCPPINWDKYHIVGESLDKLHAQQRKNPGPGAENGSQQLDHVIAAPFRPFVDKLDPAPSTPPRYGLQSFLEKS